MSSKKCIYRNCTNAGGSELTLFAFPKDPARRDIWLDSAGRSGHTLQKSDCLCELHFGRQFISSNQRRKVLVGVSIPFRYDQADQTDNDDDQQIEALDECERLDINEIFGDDDEQPEDQHSYSSNSAIEQVDHLEHLSVEDYTPETIVCDRIEIEHDKRKRKVIEHSSQNGSSQPVKLVKIDLNKPKFKNGVEVTTTICRKDEVKQKPHATTIIDHPDVSIFNIRGEEFIQMPKSVYLEEKAKLESLHVASYSQEITKLREELSKYKNTIQIIKNQLKSLP